MRKKYSSKDFTVNELPQNRKQQFFDILKTQKYSLIKITLMLLLCALPLFAGYIFKVQYEYSAITLLHEGGISEQEYFAVSGMSELIYQGGCYLFFAVFAVGLSGALRVMRQIVWGENILFFDDFKIGIKHNYVRCLLYLTLLNTCLVMLKVSRFFFGIFCIPTMSLVVIIALIVMPIIGVAMIYAQVYHITFFKSMKNSFILILNSPRLLLPIIPLEMIFIFDDLFFAYIPIFVTLAYFLLVFTIDILLLFLVASSSFDQLINRLRYPALYRKGLYNPEQDSQNIKEF
ncbi:MAG: hypothetical protein ACOX3K_05215 [Bacilli bacterium]